MDEQANMRLVQQAYQRIAQDDLPALVNMLATDVQWFASLGAPPIELECMRVVK